MMNHLRRSLRPLLFLLLAATLLLFPPTSGHSEGLIVDPVLQDRLADAAADQPLELILTYEQMPSRADLDQLAALGVPAAPLQTLPHVGALATPEQLQAILALPTLTSVYANRPLDYYLRESVRTVHAVETWEKLGYRGEGIGIAVLDTGIDGTHPDLTFDDKTVQNVKLAGLQHLAEVDLSEQDPPVLYVEDVPNTDTTSGHGTHVAGIAAASGGASDGYYRGVAPAADLIGLGAGEGIAIFTALAGFDWVIANHEEYNIRVLNNSWGISEPGFDPNDPINLASKRVYEEGIAVIFAAGNSGARTDTLNTYSVAPWVIGVAAGEKDGESVAFFSSRGIPGDDFFHPTLTAPGLFIVSDRASTGATVSATTTPTDPVFVPPEHLAYYTTASGTSMAAPHVAGAVALMVQAQPDLTPDVIKRVLVNTATPMEDYQEYAAGAGYLNVKEAVSTAESIRNIYAYRDPRTGHFEEVYDLTERWEDTVPASAPGARSSDFHTVSIPEGTLNLEVTIDWDILANDLNLYLYDPNGQLVARSTTLNSLYGYANETVHVDEPAPGDWTVEVRGSLNAPQEYRGTSNAIVLVHPR